MQSSKFKGCVRLRDALKYTGMHLGGYHYSQVEMSVVIVHCGTLLRKIIVVAVAGC